MNDNNLHFSINGTTLTLGDIRQIVSIAGYTIERRQPLSTCITLNCHNSREHGEFVGELCLPCWEHVTTGGSRFSQAYRNAIRTATEILQLHGTANAD